ncbi:MAG: hypothetical protein WB646_04120 [Steroidobacteraceae bacterium]
MPNLAASRAAGPAPALELLPLLELLEELPEEEVELGDPPEELLLLLLLLELLVEEPAPAWAVDASTEVSEALPLPPHAARVKHNRAGTAIFAFIADLSWVAGGSKGRHGKWHYSLCLTVALERPVAERSHSGDRHGAEGACHYVPAEIGNG